jgi:TPR repeat protein
MANLYYMGKLVPRDNAVAMDWLRQAANGDIYSEAGRDLIMEAGRGNADAQYNVGLLYYEGKDEDYGQAIKYWREAASHGHEKAIAELKRLKEQ